MASGSTPAGGDSPAPDAEAAEGPPTPPPAGFGGLGRPGGAGEHYSQHVAFDHEPLFFGSGDDGPDGHEDLGPPAFLVDQELIHALSQAPR